MNRHETSHQQEKLQGYLEKRSKLNFWRWWRKYWFVLDGKTLLYYKTKESYELLGACKGSINMSLAQAAQPSCTTRRSYPLEIITRTKTIQLSACDEENRQKWLAALQNAIRLPEVSSPIFQRLSSRLSGNVGKYFPDPETTDVEPSAKLQQHAEGNEDETDSDVVWKLDKPPSGKKGKISFKDEDTEEEIHTIYTACASERHISTYSFTDVDSTADGTATRYDSSDASTITLLDEINKDSKPSSKVNSLKVKHTGRFRPRSRSLYDEILDEVLEITGQRLPSSRVCSATPDISDYRPVSAGNDHVVIKAKISVEPTLLQPDKENEPDILCAGLSRQGSKFCPPKPPRMPSKKFISKKGAASGVTQKVLKTETDKTFSCEKSHDLEVDAYDSANESCYVTAESSDYEGDNSSVNSSNCNLHHHTISTCDNLPAQIINSLDNLAAQNTKSRNVAHAETGDCQENQLDEQPTIILTYENERCNIQNSNSDDILQDQIPCSSNISSTNMQNQTTHLHQKVTNLDQDKGTNSEQEGQIANLDQGEVSNSEQKPQVTDLDEDEVSNSEQKVQVTNLDKDDPDTTSSNHFSHTDIIMSNTCSEEPSPSNSSFHDHPYLSTLLFEPMESTGDGSQLNVVPLDPSTLLTTQSEFLSPPNTYEASAESQESLESVKPQTGSLCNMLDVTEDEDDDVFTSSPAKLPESSTPHPVNSHHIHPPHFSPINDAPPMKASKGYSFSVVRSAELVWTCNSPEEKPRKFSQ